MNRKYELVYVVSPDATDDQVADLHTQVEAIVQRMGGQLEKTENWGRRKLAYEIGRHKEGTYVLEVINGAGELMKEIDRRLKVTDLVIRHLVVRVDEEQSGGRAHARAGAPRRRGAGASRAACRPIGSRAKASAASRRRSRRSLRHGCGGRCDERQEEVCGGGAAVAAARPARRRSRARTASAGRCSAAARSASSARTRSTTSTTRTRSC